MEYKQYIKDSNNWLDDFPLLLKNLDCQSLQLVSSTELIPEITISGSLQYEDFEKITDITRVNDVVTLVTFDDGVVIKMVLSPEDEFDLEKCLYIAIAKKLYKRELTQEGIERKAEELAYEKRYVKIVRNALKAYDAKLKDEEKKKKELEDEQKRISRKREKKIAYKERREARKREERIDEQSEAYLRAMRIMKEDTED